MDLSKHAYFEGKIVPLSEAKISIAAHAFLYGTSVFGGMRAFWNEEKKRLFVFRPYDHFRRLLHSAKMMSMKTGYDEESLIQVTLDLLRTDNWKQDIYFRPTFYKADLGIGVRLHDIKDEFSIFVMGYEKYVKNDTDAHVTFSSWRRVDDNVIPARAKVAGAYVNSSLIKSDAIQSGFDEALVLDNNGHVSEGSAMNVFMVRDGALVTPPITDNILEGITRRTVIELARRELGIDVVERSIDRTEVYIAEEMFFAGTAAGVTGITKVDHRPIGRGVMGPVTTQLRALVDDAVRAKLPKYEHWNVAV
ncbi:MAG: Branched-chain-amino-acid aminotransferase [Anaerolineales bacterium]|nr:branched-chain amino acid transaminase [Anaerolineae bacterium]MBL8105699.1 branched-chain amino acid transaminase [Anaerolineales bacterium]MBV6401729.1 Branched-chain-amino-acid aminotransferase [Anaerolineales bacterium]MCC7189678.1 branched-chain amino acid transaminase [Anaerolineales bacterium]HQU36403.1 branched-chain amino acid transaminase [Anaerolineales bacterium]